MKTWQKIGAVVVLAGGTAAAVFARGTDEPTGETETGIETQAAERGTLEITAEAAGQIEPIRVVEVKSKASGEVMQLSVESGDLVRRGDLLGQVDPRDVRNAFEQAEADLAVAEARATTARAQLTRSQELRRANVITEQELESAQFESANAAAQLVKARTNTQLARERLNDVTIRAPIDGVIIQKNVEEGAIIQSASQNISGGTAIFLMADLSVMQVRTLVDETDLGKIKPGQSARVTVEAFPGRIFTGEVMKIEPQAVVEQNVTMFPVLVRLENPDGALKPGMNAEVVVEVARRENVVTIPNAAVVGMRDATAAGALFGYDEEQMRAAMRPSAPAGGNERGGDSAAAPQQGARPAGPVGQAAGPAPGQRPEGAQRPAGQAGQGGPAMGGGARPGGGRPGRGGIGGGDVRMGIVFVVTDTASQPKPRMVTLGLNDWDNTEVLRGIEPGEHVVLMSVARLQQQQQDMLNRMRANSSGPIPGMGGPMGPGGGGAPPAAPRR